MKLIQMLVYFCDFSDERQFNIVERRAQKMGFAKSFIHPVKTKEVDGVSVNVWEESTRG